jgi:hypothetical protein
LTGWLFDVLSLPALSFWAVGTLVGLAMLVLMPLQLGAWILAGV